MCFVFIYENERVKTGDNAHRTDLAKGFSASPELSGACTGPLLISF
jgi:hypothetical protein